MGEELVVGVDLGGTDLRTVLADQEGRFLGRVEEKSRGEEGVEAVIGRIVSSIERVTAGRARPVSVGVAAPGPINSRTGVVSQTPNLPGWKDVPLGRIIEERTGIPAALSNDANVAALGEFEYGAGRSVRHMIYITVSTGIGGGIIVDGELLEGQSGAAGEVGHVVIDPNGPKCGCGKYGHLEALASGPAIARRAREAIENGHPTIIPEVARETGLEVTAEVVAEAARRGDELARDILALAGRLLGYGIVNLIHIFNPQMVVIGGGVSNAGDLLFAPMRRVVDRGLMPVFKEDLEIVRAELGDDAGLYGAVALGARQARAARLRS